MKSKDIMSATVQPTLLESSPYYKKARALAPLVNQELRTLVEARSLKQNDIDDLFLGIEQTLTGQGQNQTLLGKAGSAVGKLGGMVNDIGRAIQDTTPVKGIDNAFADAKNKVAASLGKSKGGAQVLRALDGYSQMAKRHPTLHKALFATAAMIAGAATGGLAAPAIMGALKSVDSLIQGAALSSAAGAGIKTGAVGAAAAGVANAADAVSNMDLNPFDNDVTPVDPNAPPEVSDVYPDEADRGVKPGPDQPQPAPDVKPEPQPVPPKPVPPKPVPPQPVPPAPVPTPDVTNVPDTTGGGGQPEFNPNSTEYLDATKQNIISQNMAAQTPADTQLAQDTVTRRAAPGNLAEAFRALDFKVVALPLSIMVDRENTVRSWALHESLGRPRPKGVQLTEDGVNTVFYNIDKLHKRVMEAVYDRPANANDAAAMQKNAKTSAVNTRRDAGPVGKLPGGNVGGLATGEAPAGKTMPYLAADPKGDYKTKYSGATSNAFTRGAETMLSRAGNYIGDLWKRSTTKFEANQAKRRFKADAVSMDSNAVAQWLVGQKVPQEVITQVYQEMGFPAPTFDAAADGLNRHRMIRGLGGGVDTSNLQEPDQADAVAGADAADTAAGAADAADTVKGKGGKKSGSTGAEAIAAQSGGGAQQQKAAREIDAEIDDLIRSLRKVDNILQPAYVKYIRDALDRTFGAVAAAAPAAAPAALPAASTAGTGGGISAVNDLTAFDNAVKGVDAETKKAAERRRPRGRYIKETQAQKLARKFEAYVMGQG